MGRNRSVTTNLQRRLAEFDSYISATENPRHRLMIENFRRHNEYEQTNQVDNLLALYTDDAEFHVYGGVFGTAREQHLYGQAAIRERYETMWEKYVSKSDDPPSHLDHLMVADWGLSGIFTGENVAPGSVLALSGFDVDDPDATYRQVQKVAFFRQFRGDLVCAMTYFTSAPAIEKIA
jgi:hypothetical protein